MSNHALAIPPDVLERGAERRRQREKNAERRAILLEMRARYPELAPHFPQIAHTTPK